MIFHLSIAAENPERAARVIAALWRGEAFPFPPVAKGSWVAMAGDDRNSSIEVYPLGVEMYPVDGEADSGVRMSAQPRAHGPTHAAIASPLSQEEITALAAEHGWVTKYRKRGGIFGVIEFWIEDSVMLEVLTEEMQQEYVTRATPAGFRAMLAAGGPPKAAA
jgi:hypothetical protein